MYKRQLIRIKTLSDATGCEILAKAEFLNPGGSVKDRIALHMVRKAADSSRLSPGALITEATAGSTGVSLAMVAAASGYRCVSVRSTNYVQKAVPFLPFIASPIRSHLSPDL